MQVSVIIVNYKNPHLITQCVQSIVMHEKNIDYEIIVVDNNSEDDTELQLREIYPDLKWIQMGYNSGFAKANNAGLNIAEGEFVLFLNADTIFIEPIFGKMMQAFYNSQRIGLVGCRLLNNDKSLQLSYHNGDRFFRKIWWRNPLAIKMGCSRRNQKEMTQCRESHSVEHISRWLCGAAMMMRRCDIFKYNLTWDEDFFMYWEDVELCYRIRRTGLKVYYTPVVSLVHLGGGGTNVPLTRYEMMEKSKLKCIRKAYGRFFAWLYGKLMRLELRIELGLEKKHGCALSSALEKELTFYGIRI